MSKYVDIHQKVRTFLKASTVTYTDEAIRDGINAGCKAILPWVPKRAVANVTVTSGSPLIMELPSDVYLVDGVFDSQNQMWLKHMTIASLAQIQTQYPLWIEYPTGYLSLSLESSGNEYAIYYFTSWNEIVTTGSGLSSDLMDTPSFADLAIIYYACSYCLASAATQTSQLRQFATKIDSGNPEDNPLKDMSNMMMQRFMNEVKLMPTVEKGRQ